jgi:hypothetical protein
MSELARGLSQLAIAPDTLAWLERAVGESDKTEAGAREQALKQLKAERDRLLGRIETMYLDRLDGRITATFFDEKSKEWREQQKQIEARMAQLQTTELRSAMEAVQIMKSVSDACGLFQKHQPQQQRAIVSSLMEKGDLEGRKVQVGSENALSDFGALELCKPLQRGKPRSGQEIEIWLPKNIGIKPSRRFPSY